MCRCASVGECARARSSETRKNKEAALHADSDSFSLYLPLLGPEEYLAPVIPSGMLKGCAPVYF
ncbi:Hypothetical protein SMAX5B_002901 [Scophthalmus maximus]|uniref:Uncharacterized protein n=1 Tax=Scophthalmus maximus TaxID=52904 RepID=A0A2U9BXK1_SCOMX|nr:Hypothetical protein SMAX5B_002901 [Scophthalmus maximus]